MEPTMDRFTERAKRVLGLAYDEAKRLRHDYVGAEHLLIAVAQEEKGIGGRVLKSLGVDAARLRETAMLMIGIGQQTPGDRPPLTRRAGLALQLAAQEAAALGHRWIGTEHILIGLMARHPDADEPPFSIPLIERLGIEPATVRERVIRTLKEATGAVATRDSVVSCRVDARTLEALDALVEAGVHTTRSEAAARFIQAGLDANRPLLEKVFAAVAEIRRVREETQRLAQDWKASQAAAPGAAPPAPTSGA